MNKYEQGMYSDISKLAKALEKLVKLIQKQIKENG